MEQGLEKKVRIRWGKNVQNVQNGGKRDEGWGGLF